MNQKKTIDIVFVTILIEVIGFSMIIPILPFMFTDPNSPSYVLPAAMSKETGYLLLGILFSIYTFAQFFANPVFGQYSDKFGRRPLLKGAIMGTGVSNVLFAVGILIGNLPLLFIARFFDGITGGSIAIAQSVVADISEPKDRAKNFGIAGAALGLGFMIGPFLGGLLSNSELVPWFGPFFAFMVSAVFSFTNVFLLHKRLPETSPMDKSLDVKLFKSLGNISEIIKTKANRVLYGSSFIYSFAFTLFTSFLGVFLLKRLDYSETNIGLLFFYIGIVSIISQTQLVPRIDKLYQQYKISIVSAFVLFAALGLLTFTTRTMELLVFVLFFASANELLRTGIITITSQSGSRKEQGKVLGFRASADSLGQTIPALIAGVLAGLYGYEFPIQVATVIFGFLGLFMLILRKWLMSKKEN
ncbi:MFS transporter [Algibacter sp. AS12]|uniref:MFS transporter n=1 Tax=Algibacter sp. AS12 TaxID=3135773 RepID=UPI00398B88C2